MLWAYVVHCNTLWFSWFSSRVAFSATTSEIIPHLPSWPFLLFQNAIFFKTGFRKSTFTIWIHGNFQIFRFRKIEKNGIKWRIWKNFSSYEFLTCVWSFDVFCCCVFAGWNQNDLYSLETDFSPLIPPPPPPPNTKRKLPPRPKVQVCVSLSRCILLFLVLSTITKSYGIL